jgi:hypothetical protein
MTIAFFGSSMAHAAGVEQHGVAVFTGYGGDVARALRADGFVAYAADEDPDSELLRAPLPSSTLLAAETTGRLLERHGVTAVLPFKNSYRLEQAAARRSLRLLAAPAKLTRQLENKLQFAQIADAAGVRRPRTRQVQLDDSLLAAARDGSLDLPGVFQPAAGHGGSETRLIADTQGIEQLVDAGRGTPGKLTQLLDGDTLCVNAVVGADGSVLVGPVARQLTGVPALTTLPLGGCGNDWATELDPHIVHDVREAALRIGTTIAERGFRGVFGIDAIADGGDIFVIELNPRWTAGLSFQTVLQQLVGLPTLLDAHLSAFDANGVQASDAELREAWGSLDAVPAMPAAVSAIRAPGIADAGGDVVPTSGTWTFGPNAEPISERCHHDALEATKMVVLGSIARDVSTSRVSTDLARATVAVPRTSLENGHALAGNLVEALVSALARCNQAAVQSR